MSDPHVVALNYSITHGDSIDYGKAEPLSRDEPEFRLTVENKRVKFEFKKHYATAKLARKALAEYTRVWEFDATLKRGDPESLRLKFENAEIIDRNPTPGEVRLGATTALQASGSVALTTVVAKYPSPPSDITLNPDAETMHQRFMGYRRKHEPIGGMAYFCLSMLEDPPAQNGSKGQKAGMKRKAAAEKFNIDKSVLNEIGRLSSTRGGANARKRGGTTQSLSAKEHDFLDGAVKAIIRRVAERERTPKGDLARISLSELPSLDDRSKSDPKTTE